MRQTTSTTTPKYRWKPLCFINTLRAIIYESYLPSDGMPIRLRMCYCAIRTESLDPAYALWQGQFDYEYYCNCAHIQLYDSIALRAIRATTDPACHLKACQSDSEWFHRPFDDFDESAIRRPTSFLDSTLQYNTSIAGDTNTGEHDTRIVRFLDLGDYKPLVRGRVIFVNSVFTRQDLLTSIP